MMVILDSGLGHWAPKTETDSTWSLGASHLTLPTTTELVNNKAGIRTRAVEFKNTFLLPTTSLSRSMYLMLLSLIVCLSSAQNRVLQHGDSCDSPLCPKCPAQAVPRSHPEYIRYF